MRGNIFPFALAGIFGVVNGIYIFKPMIIEGRVKRLQDQGVDIGGVGTEGRQEAEILAWKKREVEAARAAKEAAKEEGV